MNDNKTMKVPDMKVCPSGRSKIRLHLTNVTGLGATQLLQSLLPALEKESNYLISKIYLPDRGRLSSYEYSCESTHVEVYRRWLPNTVSRVLECTVFARQFDGDSPILVLGDLPLRSKSPQTVFVQQSNLLHSNSWVWSVVALKFWVSKIIFRMNISYVQAFIVQTSLMHDELINNYPTLRGKVHVIQQPVPAWLLEKNIRRHSRSSPKKIKLNLIYPAAKYDHKNHTLLSKITLQNIDNWPVDELILTIGGNVNPAPHVPWVRCVGFLSEQKMIDAYKEVDGLLFLSKEESYGFPLLEAMYVGLPIICPDLPYARYLCGDQAIYFDMDNLASLHSAVVELQKRLVQGWWPDWSERLRPIPKDWDEVARAMLSIVEDTALKNANQSS